MPEHQPHTALAHPESASPDAVLALQRTAGNRAVQRLLAEHGAQASLKVDAANDRYEQEAEQAAAAVAGGGHKAPKLSAVTRPARASRAPGSRGGAAGFDADPAWEGRLNATRGGGRPLPASTRAAMEQGFGADFGKVRLHTDPEAVQLSRGVQARAFTRGSDIYFDEGQYAPESAQGQRLLAHELAHVVQQGGASGAAQRAPAGGVIQRLSWQNTNWDDVTRVEASKGGSQGVLFCYDDTNKPPVVVKSGEFAPSETALSARLIRQMGRDMRQEDMRQDQSKGKRSKTQPWNIVAPGARIVSPQEGAEMKQALEGIVDQLDDDQKDRASKIIAEVDQPGTVVFSYVRGKNFGDLVGGSKQANQISHTKRKWYGKRVLRKESPLNLFRDEGFVKALGRLTAADIFMGNRDRLLALNLENFMIGNNRTLKAIDNVNLGNEFAFTYNTKYQMTSKYSYDTWKGWDMAKYLATNNFQAITDQIVDETLTTTTGLLAYLPDADHEVVKHKLTKNNRVKRWLQNGLKVGKNSLVRVLTKNFNRVLAGVPPQNRKEAELNVLRRLHFILKGSDLEGQQGGQGQQAAQQALQ